MAVAGPRTALELNALDPTEPDHRKTLKHLQQAGYVVDAYKLDYNKPTVYSLTVKAKALLALKPGEAPPKTVRTPTPEATRAKRFAEQKPDSVTPSITHGSMSTALLHGPCADMLAPAIRFGAEQALAIPSRVNDLLHYRDGRVVGVHA
jgi:hypothetical protein